MACKFDLEPFTVSSYMAPVLIKFIIKTSTSLGTIRVPYVSPDSREFAGLEEFYGVGFMQHVLPEFYGYSANIIKIKEFIQTRYVDFTELKDIDLHSVRLLMTIWQDGSASFKLGKYSDPQKAFEQAAAAKRLCDLFSIPNFNCTVNSALSRLRDRNSVLLLIEPAGVLIQRQPDPLRGLRFFAKFNHKFYYKRPGTKTFLRKLQAEPNCSLAFYSTYEASRLTNLFKHTGPRFAKLTEDTAIFGRRHCTKQSDGKHIKDLRKIWQTSWARKQRFGAHNTVLVDWNIEVDPENSSNNLYIAKFNESELQDPVAPRHLDDILLYLKDMLKRYEYDVRVFLKQVPYISSS